MKPHAFFNDIIPLSCLNIGILSALSLLCSCELADIKKECLNLMVDEIIFFHFEGKASSCQVYANVLLQGCILIVFSILKLKLGLKIVPQYNFIDLDDFLTSVMIWVRLAFITGYFILVEKHCNTCNTLGLSPLCKSICKNASKCNGGSFWVVVQMINFQSLEQRNLPLVACFSP